MTRSGSSRRGGSTVRAPAAPITPEAHLPDAHGDRLVRSTFQLLLSNGSGVVLGVAFWAVAARLYTATDVGYGATEVNAMTFLMAFALLSLGSLFPRFLYPAGAKAGVVLRTGYLAATSVAFVTSILFLLVTIGHRNYMEPGLGPSVFFVVAVVLWVVFTIEDAALVGLRNTFWIPVENGSFSVMKILLLPIFVMIAPRAGVFSSWVVPVVGCTIAINLFLWRRVLPAHVARSRGKGVLPDRRVVGKVLAGEYVGGLAFGAMWALPALMIAAALGAKQVAYFQTPWVAGTSFDGLLFSFATSVMVEATARPSIAAPAIRRSVRLALVVLGPGILVILVAAPWFLRILGTEYAVHGTRLLQCLALALPFMAVNVLYVTYGRLARRVRRVLLVQVSIAVLVLALTEALIRPLGITGAGVAFLVGQGIVALALLPSVIAQYRRPDMSPGYAPGTSLVVRSRSGVTDEGILVPELQPETIQPVAASARRAPRREVPSVWRRPSAAPDERGPEPKADGHDATST